MCMCMCMRERERPGTTDLLRALTRQVKKEIETKPAGDAMCLRRLGHSKYNI